MSIIGSTQFLERIQFFNGERLFASDLQALETFNREMRWLHNQSLHQAGVGSGFQVTGNTGDRQVTVSPGYALDSCGREIVLTEPQVLPIPPVADNGAGGPAFYDLAVSYPEDSQLTPSESRVGICSPAGVINLRESPVFSWVQLSDDPNNHQPVDQRMKERIRNAMLIVLAQVQIINCQLKQPVSTVPRRNARPPRQQRIACGATKNPVWTPMNLGSPTQSQDGEIVAPFGSLMFTSLIDTRSGGFQSTPFYTPRLIGPRQFTFLDPNNDSRPFVMDALISIPADTNLTQKSFAVQIFPVVAAPSGNPTDTDIADGVNQWSVGWMGVES